MRYKIIIDSCGELLDEWKKDECFESIPLALMVGAEQIIDDETFDRQSLLIKWQPARNVRNQPARHLRDI